MSTFKDRIQKILTEALDNISAIHQEYQHQFSSDFVNYIKNVENGVRKGFDKKRNAWFPHNSVEGGLPTIAYGHKLRPGDNFSKGITEDQAIKLLNEDLGIAREKARKEIEAHYGLGIFNQLPLTSQEMLTDFVFNLGSLRSFPKFVRAVLKNDTAAITQQYKRFTNGRELAQRNAEFQKRYLASKEPERIFQPTKKPA